MPEVWFTFGPHGSFFLVTPAGWTYANLPSSLENLFNPNEESKFPKIERPFWAALGQDSYYLCGARNEKGTTLIYYFTKVHYPELSQAVSERYIEPTGVSFGPAKSYVFCISSGEYLAEGITPEIEDMLKEKDVWKRAISVSLGYGGSYVAMRRNGDLTWRCAEWYPELDRLLQHSSPYQIAFVTLNPYAPGQYFVVYGDGSIKYRVGRSCAQKIEPVILKWLGEKEEVVSGSFPAAAGAPNAGRYAGGGQGGSSEKPPPYDGSYGKSLMGEKYMKDGT